MGTSIFSFYISEGRAVVEGFSNRYRFGRYTVCTDSKTPYISFCDKNRECAVFGLAVNVFSGESNNLAEEIISCCSSISDVISFEKNLGGKYIILYRETDHYHILGDATCSIPIFYSIDKSFACTSNYQYIVRARGYLPDGELGYIRSRSDISQAMPYDVTQYREIKQLLPNHCLYVNKRVAIRFINASHPQPAMPSGKAAAIVAPMIETMCDYYKSLFNLYCPITAGRDSRVVLAFLAADNEPPKCYTLQHPGHRNDEQDLVIPRKLCAQNGFPYEQVRDTALSESLKKEMDSVLGKNHYSYRTLQIAQTVKLHYGDGAVVTGDIIGQVGKCSLHRDIRECFATPGYFRCKLHNYSSAAKKQLRLWQEDVYTSGECVDIFDLFSIENRLGRWAGQENLIYNSIGQVYLNIFNSRSILYAWTAVSRTERKNARIHISLIKSKMPSLLETPFESEESILIRLAKANGLTYLLSSYVKYYIERAKFRRGASDEKIDHNSR